MVKTNWWHDYILIVKDFCGSPVLVSERPCALRCPPTSRGMKVNRFGG